VRLQQPPCGIFGDLTPTFHPRCATGAPERKPRPRSPARWRAGHVDRIPVDLALFALGEHGGAGRKSRNRFCDACNKSEISVANSRDQSSEQPDRLPVAFHRRDMVVGPCLRRATLRSIAAFRRQPRTRPAHRVQDVWPHGPHVARQHAPSGSERSPDMDAARTDRGNIPASNISAATRRRSRRRRSLLSPTACQRRLGFSGRVAFGGLVLRTLCGDLGPCKRTADRPQKTARGKRVGQSKGWSAKKLS